MFFSNEPLQITGAKLRTQTQSFDLTQISSNTFSLAGFQAGVYSLDIITQKGSDRAAYETIIVISDSGTAQLTTPIQQTIQQKIVQETNVDVRNEREKRIFIEDGDGDGDKNNNDKKENDPCNYYGLNVCNGGSECDDDKYDCYDPDCNGTTGQCPGDDRPYGSFYKNIDKNNKEEEKTANCSGVPCTPTEKEDSWLDDPTEIPPEVPLEPVEPLEPEEPEQEQGLPLPGIEEGEEAFDGEEEEFTTGEEEFEDEGEDFEEESFEDEGSDEGGQESDDGGESESDGDDGGDGGGESGEGGSQ